MTIDDLVTALKEEFDGDVHIYENMPSQIPSPSIIIVPNEPFLETGSHDRIREQWQVLVTAKITAPDRGTTQLRKRSLQVRKALGRAGAIWVQAHVPSLASEDKSTLVVANDIELYYKADEILDEESSS